MDTIGLDRPEWFKAEWDAAVERLAKSLIESEGGETAPKQEGADDLDASAQAQESEGAAPLSPQAADSLPGFNGGASGELCDGLTVEGVRKVFAKYPVLRLLVEAAIDAETWPESRPLKGAVGIVESLSGKVGEFGGGWGRDKNGKLSTGQKEQFRTLFEVAKGAGRPSKKDKEKAAKK